MKEIVLEVVKLAAVIISSVFASGGIIMFYLKKHDRVDELCDKYEALAEGVKLGLENDIVIFAALRNGHINGESEEQEKKMKSYFYQNSCHSYDLKHHHKGGGNNE